MVCVCKACEPGGRVCGVAGRWRWGLGTLTLLCFPPRLTAQGKAGQPGEEGERGPPVSTPCKGPGAGTCFCAVCSGLSKGGGEERRARGHRAGTEELGAGRWQGGGGGQEGLWRGAGGGRAPPPLTSLLVLCAGLPRREGTTRRHRTARPQGTGRVQTPAAPISLTQAPPPFPVESVLGPESPSLCPRVMWARTAPLGSPERR